MDASQHSRCGLFLSKNPAFVSKCHFMADHDILLYQGAFPKMTL
jgi:hypothetical protein